MDEIVFVMLLLPGFCAPSSSIPFTYYFVREPMSWDDARHYCISEHNEMVQILDMEDVTTVMSIPTGGYTDKAWIGLFQRISVWFWVYGDPATYSHWGNKQPDNINASEFCVSIDFTGSWFDKSCSERKLAVCEGMGALYYFFGLIEKTWIEAKTDCDEQYSILATVPSGSANDQIKTMMIKDDVKEAWIGLRRPEDWFWSHSGRPNTFINWQPGQPDNLNGQENCAAMVVKDGTWTDEQCNATYPFFCYGLYKARRTVVRMRIQSSANMEDPVLSAALKQQLHEVFAHQGVTDLKLTWKKLPVKQTQESIHDTRCLFVL